MENNKARETMNNTYGFNKFLKTAELNENMSIDAQSSDEYESTIYNLTGGNE